ncbi:MAG: LCP family protein [Dermatophilaceae bacterium]|nr:LCP family protein [Dermatophilaceae bacterium]
MSVLSGSTSRPSPGLGLSALLVALLALSACSSPPPGATKSTKASTKSTVAPTTKAAVAKPSPFTATGVPADLAVVIKPLYFGGAVPSSSSLVRAIRQRTPVKAAGPLAVRGAVSTFKGVPIAVVASGKDVTLAVKAPRWKVVGGWWPSIGLPVAQLGGARRILLVGSDARKGQSMNKARADSLHIVGVDGHGGGGILGIARDSYVNLATGGRGKINSALTFGGPNGLRRTVVSATGVPLEGYVITGFDSFKKTIDGIGGLPINVPVAVKGAGADVFVKKGPNKLTGREALAYGRQRHTVAGGDFGRSANQGLLILAAGGFTKLAGPLRLPGILQVASPNISTDLTAEQVLTFAAATYITSPRRVHNRVAAGSIGTSSDGQSIVLFDSQARRFFADIKDGNLL